MTLRAGIVPRRQASFHAPVTGAPWSPTVRSPGALPNSRFATEAVMTAAGSAGRVPGAVVGSMPMRVVNAARMAVADVDSRPMNSIPIAPASAARASIVSAVVVPAPPARPPRPPRPAAAAAAAASAITAAAAPNRSGNRSQRCGAAPARPAPPPAPVAIGPPMNTATRPRKRAGSSGVSSRQRPANTVGVFVNTAWPPMAFATGTDGIQSVPPNNGRPRTARREAVRS